LFTDVKADLLVSLLQLKLLEQDHSK
jgi:hypothetical protein